MNNPLTENQINRINEIAQLPVDEQKKQLSEFLKTLTKEQIDFLKNQQQSASKCLFCAIGDGSYDSLKVYEDDHTVAVLDINPASKGHVLVMPKKHYRFLNEVEDTGKLFDVVKLIVNKIHEVYGADTNVLVSNGVKAGQRLDHVVVHVIPRYENDGLNFIWQPNKTDKQDLNKVMEELRIFAKIKDDHHIFPESKQEKPEMKEEAEEINFEDDERLP